MVGPIRVLKILKILKNEIIFNINGFNSPKKFLLVINYRVIYVIFWDM